MNSRALLKRKLDEHEREAEVLRSQYWKTQREHDQYKWLEFEVFLKSRSERVSTVRFDVGDVEIWFDDDRTTGVSFGDTLSMGTVWWGEVNHTGVAEVHPHSCRISMSNFAHYDERVRQLSALADILPEIQRLFSEVFPAWLEASNDLDVESLMTTRVLHWIAKQYDPTPLADIMEEVLIKMF